MAFFEELGKKISQTSQGVVQKTKNTAEEMRINGLISDEEKYINEICLQLGKKYYELHNETCEAELVSYVREIKKSYAKIEDYSTQVKKIKGLIYCPNCHNETKYGVPFCSFCGVNLEQLGMVPAKEPAPAPAEVLPNTPVVTPLGSSAPSGMAVAPEVASAPAPAVEPQVAPTPAAEPVVESAPIAEPEIILSSSRVCPKCKKPAGDNLFCTNCGTKIDAEESAPAPAPSVERKCPKCSTVAAEDSLFCINCGQKL